MVAIHSSFVYTNLEDYIYLRIYENVLSIFYSLFRFQILLCIFKKIDVNGKYIGDLYTFTSTYNNMSSQSAIRFCKICDNKYYHRLQYPNDTKSKDVQPSLIFYCRVCGYVDNEIEQGGMCVLDTQRHLNVDMFDHVYNEYTKLDPTLPHIHLPCPNTSCKTNEKEEAITDAICIRYDANALNYLYVCTECEHKWKNT